MISLISDYILCLFWVVWQLCGAPAGSRPPQKIRETTFSIEQLLFEVNFKF